jgi:hypothetical protein
MEFKHTARNRLNSPGCATYHQAAERHWARLLNLFNRALVPH